MKYNPNACIVFRRNADEYGMFSNMYRTPLKVNGIEFLTSEALYQACRFPDHPQIQLSILQEKSPMNAKGVARTNDEKTREDWYDVNILIMRWCVQIKYLQHHESFGILLDSTAPKEIVESSAKDSFWGAIPQNGHLHGTNALGRVLKYVRDHDKVKTVTPLSIPNFLLFGQQVREVK